MVSASHLARLGYMEAVGDDGWRIKPALKAQVKAVLRESGWTSEDMEATPAGGCFGSPQ